MDTLRTSLQTDRIAAGLLSVQDDVKVRDAIKRLKDAEVNAIKEIAQAHARAAKNANKMIGLPVEVKTASATSGKRGPGRPRLTEAEKAARAAERQTVKASGVAKPPVEPAQQAAA